MKDLNKIVQEGWLSERLLKHNYKNNGSFSTHTQRILLEYDTDRCNSMTLAYAHTWSNTDVSQQKD